MRGHTPWLLLLPAIASASWRLSSRYAALPLDQTVEELASARRLPIRLQDPMALRELVDRLLPWLPPRGLRPCLKRSLLLMDLWSRCGLAPSFHLGFLEDLASSGSRDGHAWVTVPGTPQLETDPEVPAGLTLWEASPDGEAPTTPNGVPRELLSHTR